MRRCVCLAKPRRRLRRTFGGDWGKLSSAGASENVSKLQGVQRCILVRKVLQHCKMWLWSVLLDTGYATVV